MTNENKKQPGLAYLLLRNSLKLFEKPWQKLADDEKATAQRESEEEYHLQRLILATDEAATVVIAPNIPSEAIGMIRQRFPDPESFEKEMLAHGLNIADLHQAISDELRVDGALSIIGQRGGKPTTEEISNYYQNHPQRFNTPELRKARHILITINDDFPDNTREQASKRIDLVKKELTATPERFEELAQRYSECPSALRGGELGEVAKGKISPALDQTLFDLKEGEISDIVESHLGFHILFCEKITPATTLTMEEATPHILQLLTRKRQHQAQKEWLKHLTTK